MKKIINWTFGSVFRTLGRILTYLALGGLIAFICVKNDIKITQLFGIETIKADTITISSPQGFNVYSWGCNYFNCSGGHINRETGLTNFGTSASIDTTTDNAVYPQTVATVYTYSFNKANTYTFSFRIHLGGNSHDLDIIKNDKLYNNWYFGVYGYKNSTEGYVDDYINSASCNVRYDDTTSNGFLAQCNVALNSNVSRIRITTGWPLMNNNYIPYGFTSMRVNLIEVDETAGQGALIDKQTNQLIQNQNQSTNQIITNQNQNTQEIIDSQNQLLGSKCENIFNKNLILLNNISLSGNNKSFTLNGSGYGGLDLSLEKGTYYINSKDLTNDVDIYINGNYITSNKLNNYTFTLNNNGTLGIVLYSNTYTNFSIFKDNNKSYCEYGSYQSKLDDTNNSINNIKDSLLDSSSPSLSGLSNNTTAGWLPAGPLDSVLNLPLTFLNSLISGMSGSCAPLRVPLPYVNLELPIPCMSTIYTQMGFGNFFNWVGNIAAAFILFTYLLKLYKYVDDTLTFRENNFIDNWSGV